MNYIKSLLLVFLVGVFGCSPKLKSVDVLEADNQKIPVIRQDSLEALFNQKGNKVHVVNFWATWCAPCVKELPYFEELQAKHGDQVKVTLVSLDFEESLETKLVPFVNKKNISSDVVALLIDNEAELIESVSSEWGGNIPATVIYYKNEKTFIEGATTYNELIEKIEAFKKLN